MKTPKIDSSKYNYIAGILANILCDSKSMNEFTHDEVESAKLRLSAKDKSEITIEFISEVLGRKWRGNAIKCYNLTKVLQKIYHREGVVKPISTRSTYYQNFILSDSELEETRHRELSRVLSNLRNLGLLELVKDEYHYNSNDGETQSYCYLFNNKLSYRFTKWVEDNINLDDYKLNYDNPYNKDEDSTVESAPSNSIEDKELLSDGDINDLITSSINEVNNLTSIESESAPTPDILPLKIKSRTLITKDISNDELIKGLYKSYPYLPLIMSKVESINNVINNSNFTKYGLISYKPKLKYSKNHNITGISIRASSPISNVKSIHNMDSTSYSYIDTREDILINDWYSNDIVNNLYSIGIGREGNPTKGAIQIIEDIKPYITEFDVTSSVPRVAYLLHTGTWLDTSIDIYDLMFNKNGMNTLGLDRAILKRFFMYFYFSGSKQVAINSILHKVYPSNDDLEVHNYLVTLLSNFYDGMVSVIGEPIGSEIFLHESNLYILVREEILKLNIDCCQVYDAFIFKTDDFNKVNIKWLLSKCAVMYYNLVTTGNLVTDKILCISDYHIDNYRKFNPTKSDYDRLGLTGPIDDYRLNQSVTFAKYLVKYGQLNNIRTLFIAGDLINKPNTGPKVLHTMKLVLSILLSQFYIYYILGQHDLASRSNDPDIRDSSVNLITNDDPFGNNIIYAHNKCITFTNSIDEDIEISFKNYQYLTSSVDFGNCDVAVGHLSLTMGQSSVGTHKVGVFGDIHDLVECRNSSGGMDYSIGTPYQLYPSQPEEGHVGLLDISNKSNIKFSRISSNTIMTL